MEIRLKHTCFLLQGIRPATLSWSFRRDAKIFADKYLMTEKFEKLLAKV